MRSKLSETFAGRFLKTFKSARPLPRTFACRLSCVLSRVLNYAGQWSQAFAGLFAFQRLSQDIEMQLATK